MNNKFSIEILKGYEKLEIKSEITFEYGRGYIKLDDIEIAEFDRLEINIQPIIKKVSLLNSNGDDGRVIAYKINANLNVSTRYSRYNQINLDSQLNIEVVDEIVVFKCGINSINGDKMI